MSRTVLPILLLFLTLALALPLQADTQSVPLHSGYRFWALTLSPGPPLTSRDLFERHSVLTSLFRFEPLRQEFKFQLRLPDGSLFGEDQRLNPGYGYIVEATGSDTIEITGTAMVNPYRRELYDGFVLTGFPDPGVERTAAQILAAYYEVSSIFRWDEAQAAFQFFIRLDPTRTFGTDFTLQPGTAYFIRAKSSSTFYLDTLAGGQAIPTLSSVSVSPTGATVTLGSSQIFTATANWSDGSTTDVSGLGSWQAVSSGGSGTMNGSLFTATAPGSVLVTVSWSGKNGETTANVISSGGVQPGVNLFSILSPSVRTTASLDAFQSNEEAVVIFYEGTTTDSGYPFTFEGRIPTAAPARLSLALPQDFPAGETPCVDARNRAMERITAPVAAGARAPRLAPSRAPAVGDEVQFWCLNSLNWPPSSTDWTLVTATCRAVGSHCYMFEDNNTPSGYEKFPPSAWPELQGAFDNEIYPADTTTFGAEPRPGIDGDERVYILYTWNVNRQRASGYFDSTNEMSQAQASALSGGVYYSNEKEIFFMQVPSTSDNWSTSLKHHILGVLAHEFLHMIVYNQHRLIGGATENEEDWLNEGLAQVAQDVTGYGYQKGTLSFTISPYLSSTGSYSLTNFTFSLGQYGMAYLFVRYLADQGVNLKNLVSTTRRGVANVEAVTGKSFQDLFRDWSIAVYNSGLNVSSDPRYRYSSINLRSVQADGTTLHGPQFTSQTNNWPFNLSASLRGTGVRYYRIFGGTGDGRHLEFLGSYSGRTGAAVIRKNQ